MNLRKSDHIISTDLLVIGGGGAGARAAIEAAKYGIDVTLVSKGKLGRSGSTPISGGGLSGPYPKDIRSGVGEVLYQIHLEDSEGLCDQPLAKAIAEECIARADDLESYGVNFADRWAGEHKTHYKIKDRLLPTHRPVVDRGYGLMWGLRKETLQRGVKVLERVMITKLLRNNGRVVGAVGIKTDSGESYIFAAKASILAAGSATGLYPYTSALRETTGDSFALAFDAGARLVDVEFVEFQVSVPFLLLGSSWTPSGGRYYNREGKLIPNSDRRFEDSMAVYKEIKEGRGPVYTDGRAVDFSRWPAVEPHRFEMMKAWGIDRRKLRVLTMMHSVIGGIRINDRTETGLEGLYAAGEATGGVHGASRLHGQALAETQVFGQRAGMYASKYALKSKKEGVPRKEVEREKERFNALLTRKKGISPDVLKKEIQGIMEKGVNVLREEKGLTEAVDGLNEMETSLKKLGAKDTRELIKALEVQNLHLSAQMLARAALERKESRGSHQRTDYPERNDKKWLKHVAISREAGGMKLSLIPVEIISSHP